MPTKKRPYPSLKVWRHEARLKSGDAARFLAVSPSYYSRIERQQKAPMARIAKAISEKTGVPLETILGIA